MALAYSCTGKFWRGSDVGTATPRSAVGGRIVTGSARAKTRQAKFSRLMGYNCSTRARRTARTLTAWAVTAAGGDEPPRATNPDS